MIYLDGQSGSAIFSTKTYGPPPHFLSRYVIYLCLQGCGGKADRGDCAIVGVDQLLEQLLPALVRDGDIFGEGAGLRCRAVGAGEGAPGALG